MKNYVAGFMFSKDGENIALIVKNKPDWQKGLLNGIGGKVELQDMDFCHGDAIYNASLRAMVREFEEETGVTTHPEQWSLFVTLGSHNGNSNADATNGHTQQYDEGWSVDFYRCFTDKVFHCKTITDEQIKVMEVSEALCSKTIDNLKWLILLALDKNPKFTKVKY